MNSLRLKLGSVWLVLSCIALGAGAEESEGPHARLAEMNKADRTLNYEGTLSYFDGMSLNTMMFSHVVIGGIEHERIVHLNGEHREIITRGRHVEFFHNTNGELLKLQELIGGITGNATDQSLESSKNVYRIEERGSGRVAGREATVVHVVPQDSDRNVFEFTIDDDSNLLLQLIVRSQEGELLEIMQFSSIVVGDVSWQPTMSNSQIATEAESGVVDASELQEAIPISPWQPGFLPEGFTITNMHNVDDDEKAVTRQFYSDGLVGFSIFVEKRGPDFEQFHTQRGATVVVSEEVRDSDGIDHVVTVVGEVPVHTARKIAQAVEYRQ